MKVTQMLESKYLKQSDVEGEVPVTIRKLNRVNVARDDEEPEYRWTAQFAEFGKPMVLNSTNIKRLAKALGDDTDEWIGKTAILYVDENVEFGGNVVGGLRLKGVPRGNGAKPAPRRSLDDVNADLNNDPPF